MPGDTPTPTPAPLLVDVRTAASMLSISVRTLFSLTKQGHVPCARVFSRVLYNPATLKLCVESWEGTNDDAPEGNGGPGRE